MNDKEYVDKKSLVRHIEDSFSEISTPFVVREIKKFPSSDVVEVVRCKDCKHYGGDKGSFCRWYSGPNTLICTHEDDFCSSGERTQQKECESMSRKHHYVKILPEYYIAVEKGIKTFEIRFHDRDYQVGDILHLQEYCGDQYTSRELTKEICYMIEKPEYCKEGFVVLGIKDIK